MFASVVPKGGRYNISTEALAADKASETATGTS